MADRRRQPQDRAREAIVEARRLLESGTNPGRVRHQLERAEADLASVEAVAGEAWVLIHAEDYNARLRDRDHLAVRGLFTTLDAAQEALPVERWVDHSDVHVDEHSKSCCRIERWRIHDAAPFLGPAPATQLHEHVWRELSLPDGMTIRACGFPKCNTLEPVIDAG